MRLTHRSAQPRGHGQRDAEVELTAKEFDMLYLLARHPRQVFTREQLLDRVWGGAQYIDPGTVTVHVRRLREKIEERSIQARSGC